MRCLGGARGAALTVALLALAALAAVLPAAAAAQGPGGPGGPRWELNEFSWPTNFAPDEANDAFLVAATNVGGEPTSGPIVVQAQLPEEVEFVFGNLTHNAAAAGSCSASGASVTCEANPGTVVKPGEVLLARIVVNVDEDAAGVLVGTASVSGGGAGVAPRQARVETPVGAGPAAPGFAPGTFFSTVSSDQAGAHPNASAGFTLTTIRRRVPHSEGPAGPVEVIEPAGSLDHVAVETPPGLIGSAQAAPKCSFAQFSSGTCPPDTQIGVETLILNTIGGGFTPGSAPLFTAGTLPLYNLTPPEGVPAEFATAVLSVIVLLKPEVRSGGDYGLTINVGPTSQAGGVFASTTTFFGNPARENGTAVPGVPSPPFVYNPTFCGPGQASGGAVSFYQTRGNPLARAFSAPQSWTGCDAVPFAPSLALRPTTTVSDQPSGLDVDLHIPQSRDAEQLASADLREAVVKLPPGLAINPAVANRLEACSPAEIDLHGRDPAHCPPAAKIGTVEIETPLLDHPIPGGVYVAQPGANPFGSLLAVYVAAHDPVSGTVIKLAGKIEADQRSGQLTARFSDNPQLPFDDFKLKFFDGPGAALSTPLACGTHVSEGTLTPWSGTVPVTARASFAIERSAGGGSCPREEGQAPNHPEFEAGTTDTRAGAYAPFVLRLRRDDGSQRLRALQVKLPEGLLAKLAGVPYCPEAAIAAAAGSSARGQLAARSCPAASELGRVTVSAGAGPNPFSLDSGRAYLAGPYRGAPLSLVIVTPALAGPYDLGTVVVRAALEVDPRSAAVTAVSDPIPTILEGIPLDLRSIAVAIDRPGFTRNPTSCDPAAVTAEASSPAGSTASLSSRFQVGGCRSLGFAPRLQLQLRGATRRGGHPALKAILTWPKRGSFANIARAQVGLPHSLFLDQSSIGTVCTQAQLQARNCPKRSVYGRARAWTPLLEKPLEGPVYLGAGYGHKLPDLVADLDGQIRILLNGRIDTTKRKGLRTTFEAVPDAPVSRFVLQLKGGRRFGLIENSTDLCARAQRASVAFVAQNALRLHRQPRIAARCGKAHAKTKARRGGHR